MIKVTRLVGVHQCAEYIVNKWDKEEGQRPCRFPALWRIKNGVFEPKNYCTRHGGLHVLTYLANEAIRAEPK